MGTLEMERIIHCILFMFIILGAFDMNVVFILQTLDKCGPQLPFAQHNRTRTGRLSHLPELMHVGSQAPVLFICLCLVCVIAWVALPTKLRHKLGCWIAAPIHAVHSIVVKVHIPIPPVARDTPSLDPRLFTNEAVAR